MSEFVISDLKQTNLVTIKSWIKKPHHADSVMEPGCFAKAGG